MVRSRPSMANSDRSDGRLGAAVFVHEMLGTLLIVTGIFFAAVWSPVREPDGPIETVHGEFRSERRTARRGGICAGDVGHTADRDGNILRCRLVARPGARWSDRDRPWRI